MKQDHPSRDDTLFGGKRNHAPVLLTEVLHYLNPQKGESLLDVTAGYGGHASAILERTKSPESAVLVDRDMAATEHLIKSFSRSKVIHQDFYGASKELAQKGEKIDMILADLGVSSAQLDEASRGFSIKHSGPLDMRMDTQQRQTAANIINRANRSQLLKIIREYGEEAQADKIVDRILMKRPIYSTNKLVELIEHAVGKKNRDRIHPATKTFQAIRIAVNDELTMLQKSLPVWQELLKSGGRLVLISFHSLEDRIVKQFMIENSSGEFDSSLILLTQKPITAQPAEIALNPRARSAKLRACSKK